MKAIDSLNKRGYNCIRYDSLSLYILNYFDAQNYNVKDLKNVEPDLEPSNLNYRPQYDRKNIP